MCHIRDDDPTQVFGGHAVAAGHPYWSSIVRGTNGRVVVWQGEVALTKFTSSTGGRTERQEDAGGPAFPYLVSVDDSAAHTVDASNPFSSWSASVNQAALGGYFGFSWLSDVQVLSRNESGSTAAVQLYGIISGRPAQVLTTGRSLRDVLGLHSAYFDLEVVPRFVDVVPAHPFAGEILGLHELGVTRGCSEGLFCPDKTVTRGEMAAFLVRALDLPAAGGNHFDDDNGSVFEGDIEALRSAGVTDGCTPTMFCPEDPVTRAEMAAFLIRAMSRP